MSFLSETIGAMSLSLITSRTTFLLSASLLLVTNTALAASYPPNIDYGTKGDFIAKRGTEFGRTADLTTLGPVLFNFPEGPGSSDLSIEEFRFEDTAWDLSDLTNPTLIRSLTCDTCFATQPIGAHATVIRFAPELGPLIWAGDDYFRYDAETDEIHSQEFFDWGTPPLSYTTMFSLYHTRTYWEYGFDPSGLYAIRDPSNFLEDTSDTEWLGNSENVAWLGEPLVAWDHLGETGVTGFTSWLGNLLVVASDQQSTGIAIYDVSGFREGQQPELLSVYNPQLTEPPNEYHEEPNTIGIGGYWAEPYGTNKIVWAARERSESIPARYYPSMFIVDFTDPRDPRLTCALRFNLDNSDPTDGDWTSDPMYVNFQDNYAFVDHFKVDIDACEAAYDDEEITREEFDQIVFRFYDFFREDGSFGGCDSSQYFRPLGQVGVFGGYDWPDETEGPNEQGMCFFVTDDEPDTNPPYISGHRPLANQTLYPVDAYIHLHIPETLRSETLINAITVTNLETDTPITFKHQLTHTGTVSIWPDEYFAENTSYRVDVAGIQDFMGNTMEPYVFTFSTGADIEVTDPSPLPAPDPTAPDPNETPAPSYDGLAFYPNQSSLLACEAEVDNGSLWVVNPDNDSVTIINRETDSDSFALNLSQEKEIKLGYESPSSVTKVGQEFAVTYRDDDKIIFFDGAGNPLAGIDTGHGTQPVSSIADGSTLYIALYGSGEVIKIDAESREISARLNVGPNPKAMAFHEGRLLVTRFISTPDFGEVYDINTVDTMSLSQRIIINKVRVPDDIDHGSGVPNYLSSIVINQDGSRAYVTANKANIDRGSHLNNHSLDGDNTIRPMIATINLTTGLDTNEDPSNAVGTIDLDNGADPSSIIFLPNADIRVHALQGNNVVVANHLTANTAAQFTTGLAPQSMCTTLRTLYVKNFTERSISAIDIAGYMHNGSLNPSIQTIPTVSNETLSEQELLGLQLFYHSRMPDMGPEGYMSCASCHAGGGHDGMTWDLTHLGEGLRNTLSLNGSSGTRFGNLHWSGNFDEVQDFEIQIEQLNGGTGLIEGLTFTDQSPLDLTTAEQSDDLDALAAYVNGLGKNEVLHSPHRRYSGELSEAAQRGKVIFDNDNCTSCHIGNAYRDGLRHDVGTIAASSGNRLGETLTAIRTPTLVQLWDSAPYFHDGSAATLADVLTRGDHARELDDGEVGDLAEYLLSLDRQGYIEDNEVFELPQIPEEPDTPQPNMPPEGRNDLAETGFNTPLTLSVSELLSNDIDAEGDPLSIVIVDDPINGTVSFSESRDGIVFSPSRDFSGTASFTYSLSDGIGDGFERLGFAIVTITVTDDITIPPVFFDLIVNGGSGDGEYAAGSTITISADTPTAGQTFASWISGDTINIDDANSATTTVTLQATSATITATYTAVADDDMEAPSPPSGLQAGEISSTSLSLSWNAATDNVGVDEYMITVNGETYERRTAQTRLTLSGLSPATDYDISVTALDRANNTSPASEAIAIRTLDSRAQLPFNTYFFGHSLVYHTFTDYPDVDEVSIPHWLYLFSQTDGRRQYAADGEFGAINYTLPPTPQWGFDLAPSAWNNSFAESNYDAVIYTDLNYVQYQPPSEPYFGSEATPISAALRSLDFVLQEEPSSKFYIYENWADAGGFAPDYDPRFGGNTPPTSQQVADYHAYNGGDYHAWWIALQDAVVGQRGDANVKMIPVGLVLSGLLTESDSLNNVPFEELFEDNAPHGRPAVYFLAAMIQYMAFFEERTPEEMDIPESVHSAVRNNYLEIREYIWQQLNEFNFADGSSRVW